MAVYQSASYSVQIDNGTSQPILAEQVTNGITGATGVHQVKFQNSGTYQIATVSWTNTDRVWTYENVPATGGTGNGAQWTINVTYNGLEFIPPFYNGIDYTVGDILTISGDLIGGTSPANDVTITVTSVRNPPVPAFHYHAVLDYTTSYASPWPVSVDGLTLVSPGATEFVQVSSDNQPKSMYFTDESDLDYPLYIAAVNVVG